MLRLLSFLAGPSGKTSHMRVMTSFVVVSLMGTWTAVSLKKWELQPMDIEFSTTLLGVLGIGTYQRHIEKMQPKPQP